MKKITVFAGMFILALFTIYSSAYAFDKECPENLEVLFSDSLESLVPIITNITVLGVTSSPEPKLAKGQTFKAGRGFVVGRYIVTAAHVIEASSNDLYIPLDKKQKHHYINRPIKTLEQNISIELQSGSVKADIVWKDSRLDIAILWPHKKLTVSQIITAPTIHWDNASHQTKSLLIADECLILIPPNHRVPLPVVHTYFILKGAVVAPHGIAKDTKQLTSLSPNTVTMSMRLRHGYSGSPIFAFINGKPVIVGVVSAMNKLEPISYMSRIDPAHYILLALEKETAEGNLITGTNQSNLTATTAEQHDD